MKLKMNRSIDLSMLVEEFQMIIDALHLLQSKQTYPTGQSAPTALDCLVNSVEVFAKDNHVVYK